MIDAVGPGVTDRAVGDRVMAIALPLGPHGGAQAELVVVPTASLAAAPAGATLEEAATLPMNGLTVRLALDTARARARPDARGDRGGRGRRRLRDRARQGRGPDGRGRCGARTTRSWCAGSAPTSSCRAARAARPRSARPSPAGSTRSSTRRCSARRSCRRSATAARSRRCARSRERPSAASRSTRSGCGSTRRNQPALEELGRLAGERRITLRVAETFAPERAAEAHRRLEAGGVRGRLLIAF